MKMPAIACLLAALSAVVSVATEAADWTHFRGPDRNGISKEEKAPLEWSPTKNIKWKAPLPSAGNSSPAVSGDRVFVTCAENKQGTRRSLYCFSRADGKQLWVKTVSYDKPDPTHATNPYCAASPAADGKHVIAWHGSAGLHCYDYEGNLLWSRDLGVIRHIWGWAGSPVIHGDAVYLNVGPGVRQLVCAIDRSSGEVLWQTDEPGGAADKSRETGDWIGSWSTPVVTTVDGREQVLVFMARRVNAYEPKTGKKIWWVDGAGDLAYTDVLVADHPDGEGKVGVAMAGYAGTAIGFKLGGEGDMTQKNRLWQSKERPPQRVGSGVIVGRHVYVPNEPNLACFDLLTGKQLWTERPGRGSFWSSIIATSGAEPKLYVTSKQGATYVFKPDPAGLKLLATNDLGESSNATPAISDGQIFLRTDKHLWCVE
jgi:outer membrane protein assembly factor BamB